MPRLKFALVLCLPLITLAYANAQQQEINRAVRSNNILTRMGTGRLGSGDVVMGMPSTEKSEVIGDTYWDKHWGQSSVQLYKNDEYYDGHFTRYDIKGYELEFKTNAGIKVLRGDLVKNVVWIDSLSGQSRVLVNARDFKEEGVPLSGFLEQLVDGKASLYKKVYLEILKPDFNPALNVGSKDTRIVKKETLYFHADGNLTKIKSRKSLEPLLKANPSATEFAKAQDLKLTKEADLIKLFTFLSK